MSDLWESLGFFRKPMRYMRQLGGGHSVSASVLDEKMLLLRFERKIEPDDVRQGRLVPIAVDTVKRRGGKRQVYMKVSRESAEALHIALGKALKDARQRERAQGLFDRLSQFVMYFYQIKSHA